MSLTGLLFSNCVYILHYSRFFLFLRPNPSVSLSPFQVKYIPPVVPETSSPRLVSGQSPTWPTVSHVLLTRYLLTRSCFGYPTMHGFHKCLLVIPTCALTLVSYYRPLPSLSPFSSVPECGSLYPPSCTRLVPLLTLFFVVIGPGLTPCSFTCSHQYTTCLKFPSWIS